MMKKKKHTPTELLQILLTMFDSDMTFGYIEDTRIGEILGADIEDELRKFKVQ